MQFPKGGWGEWSERHGLTPRGAKFLETSFPYFYELFDANRPLISLHNEVDPNNFILYSLFFFENAWPIKRKVWYTLAAPDPDLEITERGGGAVSKIYFWSENKRGQGEPGPRAPPLDQPQLKYFSIYSFIYLIGSDHNLRIFVNCLFNFSKPSSGCGR